MVHRSLPKKLQIELLKKIFTKLNPGVSPDVIDWEAEVDETLTFAENRNNLSQHYPVFRWYEVEEEKDEIEEANEAFSYLEYVIDEVPDEKLKAEADKTLQELKSRFIDLMELVRRKRKMVIKATQKAGKEEERLKESQEERREAPQEERKAPSEPEVHMPSEERAAIAEEEERMTLEDWIAEFVHQLDVRGVRNISKYIPRFISELRKIEKEPAKRKRALKEALVEEIYRAEREREAQARLTLRVGRKGPYAPPEGFEEFYESWIQRYRAK